MLNKLCAGMVHLALNRPKAVTWVMAISTLLVITLAAVPSVWPEKFKQFHHITVDTDPENMLSQDEPVRVFHHEAKQRFALSDIVVVGIINHRHPQGVFNAESLERIYQLTEFAKRLQWDGEGVISIDLIAPSTIDNIEQGGLGSVNFSWLMSAPPTTDEAALQVLQRAQHIPFLNGTLVSEDGQALALYLPITKKDLSYRIRSQLLDFTSDWAAQGDEVHITGLPVAEDTFGVEMFIQMAISAPLAMLVIFLLLWWFFKKLILVVSPMIIAMVSSLATMGLLIATGNTIHIMSSMIPIFIVPIAVLDAVHILSEFFDRYPVYKDRRKAIEEVMTTLFAPMLFTTLTTMAGFGSLMLTPIPPVQVFGLFIAIGVFLAWLWTILFIPAYIMLIDEKRLEGYGHHVGEEDRSLLGRMLKATGKLTTYKPRLILVLTLVAVVMAGYGISKIVVNDNPTRWFEAEHPIRVADRVLNEHFGGTYMAYLELAAPDQAVTVDKPALLQQLSKRQADGEAMGNSSAPYRQFATAIEQGDAGDAGDAESLMAALTERAEQGLSNASDEEYYSWDDIQLFLEEQQQRSALFKQPEVLHWMESLQAHLLNNPKVGKVNSLTDVVKTVYRELQLGEDSQFRIPDSANAVAQTLITYQNSHRPHDLWHFVTPDYHRTVLWLQLSSGDNRDMEAVVQTLDEFLASNPPPLAIDSQWFGLTYINVVWQGKMVSGMLSAFLGSFVVVLVMMIALFRSLTLGVLAMIPLAVTVGLIYGIIGLIGKDYDMPVAVLSALSLGLAVDYAIHFLARSRTLVEKAGSWRAAVPQVFGEPARAISRNAIILGAGFLPLLAAPLVPYQTVGIFIASIILSAGAATLLILPALLTLLKKLIFKVEE
ncbi:efflux RND transporter permease subunit [Porticoccus sp.]